MGRAFYLQVFQHDEWSQKAQKLTVKDMIIKPNRGDIYSVNKKLLATSVPFYEVRIDTRSKALSREVFEKNVDSLATKLSLLFEDKTKTQYLAGLQDAYKKGSRYYLIQRKVSFSELKQLKRFPIFRKGRYKGGFVVIQKNRRNKPFKSLASRTLGRLQNKGEKHTLIGLEGAYDKVLSGREGVRLMRKLSDKVWMPVNDANEVEPQDGIDLLTTIDVNIQDVAQSALLRQMQKQKAEHGTAIVMEVATGEIRAISNLKMGKDSSYYEHYNYAVGESTEPGSTFKLASIIAALEDGKVSLTDTVHTFKGSSSFYGFTIRDSKKEGHGLITAQESFELSSNIGIARLIERHYGKHPEEFVKRLFNMGLNQKLGVEIKGETSPYIKYTNDKLWTKVSLPQMSIGYEVKQTPLQILSFYNAIANGGKLMRPMFVKALLDQDKVIKEYQPHVLNPAICSPKTIEYAQKLLEGVVERGTARNINNSKYKIAGKTGTAKIFDPKKQQYISKYKASFVGYFPAEKPRYSCFVMISAPKVGLYYGSTVAAPVFKKIADKIFLQDLKFQESTKFAKTPLKASIPYTKNGQREDLDFLLDFLAIPKENKSTGNSDWIITTKTEKSIAYSSRTVTTKSIPLVTGMSAKDAVFILENLGLKVRLNGRGTVISQSVSPDTPITKGREIVLDLI